MVYRLGSLDTGKVDTRPNTPTQGCSKTLEPGFYSRRKGMAKVKAPPSQWQCGHQHERRHQWQSHIRRIQRQSGSILTSSEPQRSRCQLRSGYCIRRRNILDSAAATASGNHAGNDNSPNAILSQLPRQQILHILLRRQQPVSRGGLLPSKSILALPRIARHVDVAPPLLTQKKRTRQIHRPTAPAAMLPAPRNTPLALTMSPSTGMLAANDGASTDVVRQHLTTTYSGHMAAQEVML